ncbi:monocarboxylate permease [Amanita rubescens]|nr:monocarboxylate permease [Amanita rubescens]
MVALGKLVSEKAGPLSLANIYVDSVPDKLPEKEPTPEFPEGGRQAWLTVVGAILLQFVGFGYINTFGVYQDFYVRKYLTSYSPSAIGWIGGAQLFLTFFPGVFVGNAFDRGYFRHLIIATTVLHALALFTLSVSHENHYYQVFLSQGVCFGLSVGLTYSPSLAIVSHYFKRRRTLAIGLVTGGSSLGAITHSIMLNRFFNGPIGFHNGVRISAALNVCLLLVANITCKTRLPPRKTENRLRLKDFICDPPYVLLIIGIFLTFCGLFFPFFYLQLNAVYHNVNTSFAFYALSILNAANLFGRTIPPAFAPTFGVYNMFISFTVAMGIALLCMAAIKNVTGVVLVAIFYGFLGGGAVSLAPAALGVLARNVDEVGARIGFGFGVCGIMALFAQPISGALLTGQLQWLHAILFAGITIVVSAIFILAARRFVAQRRSSWRV